jgi:Flp pilus assembly protein TadG
MTLDKQSGIATVEFAVVAVLVLTVILSCIDISRLYFSSALLNEATRRGARLAAVCPVNDSAIAQAVINQHDSAAPLLPGLQVQHIRLEYLNSNGSSVTDPGGEGFRNVHLVRVSIEGFQLQTVIPGLSQLLQTPNFAATLPRESLGYLREDGTLVPC